MKNEARYALHLIGRMLEAIRVVDRGLYGPGMYRFGGTGRGPRTFYRDPLKQRRAYSQSRQLSGESQVTSWRSSKR